MRCDAKRCGVCVRVLKDAGEEDENARMRKRETDVGEAGGRKRALVGWGTGENVH